MTPGPNLETATKRQFGIRDILVAMTGICCLVRICTQLAPFVSFRTSLLTIYFVVSALAFYYLIFGTLLVVLAAVVVAMQFAVATDEDARARVLKTGRQTLRSLIVTLLFALVIFAGGMLAIR